MVLTLNQHSIQMDSLQQHKSKAILMLKDKLSGGLMVMDRALKNGMASKKLLDSAIVKMNSMAK